MNTTITINDRRIEETLAKDGFTKVPLIGNSEIGELTKLYEKYFSATQNKDKYNFDSNADCSPDVKRIISEGIHKIIKPRVDLFFENYEFLPAIFFIKKPGANSQVTMHQDPTLLIDESDKTHIKIWIPLNDVDGKNGALQMIRGSHLFVPPVSAATVPSHFSEVDHLLYEAMECVSLKAGEVVMFDNRTLHCSMPNLSNRTRITAIVSIVATQRQFISLYSDPKIKNSPIEVYFQEHDWFYDPKWANTLERPKTGVKVGVLNYSPVFVNEEEFVNLIKHPRALRKYKYRIVKDKKRFFPKLRSLFSLPTKIIDSVSP